MSDFDYNTMKEIVRAEVCKALSDVDRPSPECLNAFSKSFHAIDMSLQTISQTLSSIDTSVAAIRDQQKEFEERLGAMETAVEELMRWRKNQWKVIAWIWGVVAPIGGFVIMRLFDCVIAKYFGNGIGTLLFGV